MLRASVLYRLAYWFPIVGPANVFGRGGGHTHANFTKIFNFSFENVSNRIVGDFFVVLNIRFDRIKREKNANDVLNAFYLKKRRKKKNKIKYIRVNLTVARIPIINSLNAKRHAVLYIYIYKKNHEFRLP